MIYDWIEEYEKESEVLPIDVIFEHEGRQYKAVGLWDTGASSTIISENIVHGLNLHKEGEIDIVSATGDYKTNTYRVDIILPGGIRFRDKMMSNGLTMGNGYDALIGMDIIRRCSFAYDNSQKNQTLRYKFTSKQYDC